MNVMNLTEVTMKRMILIWRAAAAGCGLFFMANASWLMAVSNFNLGSLLELFLGLIFVYWGMEPVFLRCAHFPRRLFWLRRLCLFGTAFLLIVSMFLFVVGARDTATMDEDVIIILGAGVNGERVSLVLQQRLEKGVEYLKQNPQAVVVVTGGQGPGEDISEALAMERYLLRRGVVAQRILKEDRSTSTKENFLYTRAILDEYFSGAAYRGAVVTNDFHAYRAQRTAEQVGLEVSRYSSDLHWSLYPASYLRESLAVLKLWVW